MQNPKALRTSEHLFDPEFQMELTISETAFLHWNYLNKLKSIRKDRKKKSTFYLLYSL